MPRALQDYFAAGDARIIAWEAYSRFADEFDWTVPSKMKLYDESIYAFGGQGSEEERFAKFEVIYTNLKGDWQVFRSSHGHEAHWDAREIFAAIQKEFSSFGWESGVTLLTPLNGEQEATLLKSFDAMARLKSNSGYPTMAVSKFLHFYNPSLFPIFDTEVIWGRVFHCFRNEYRSFCSGAGLDHRADGASFLQNYMRWGGFLLSAAGPEYMSHFIDWLREELPPKQFKRLGEPLLERLYATAFELTAIGAAVAEETKSIVR